MKNRHDLALTILEDILNDYRQTTLTAINWKELHQYSSQGVKPSYKTSKKKKKKSLEHCIVSTMATDLSSQLDELTLGPSSESPDQEPSPEIIKEIISEEMKKEGITTTDIPDEIFSIDDPKIRKSLRYFDKHGVGQFHCPKGDNDWTSVFSWCFIDLKEQKINYRYYEECQNCDCKANPKFSKEIIEKMARLAVITFLERTGRRERPERTGDYSGHGGGPHKEERCEKCIRLGYRCC